MKRGWESNAGYEARSEHSGAARLSALLCPNIEWEKLYIVYVFILEKKKKV